jgi:hypothetical protein
MQALQDAHNHSRLPCFLTAVNNCQHVRRHCKTVQRAAEDLGASLYPPQDAAEVWTPVHTWVACFVCLV